MKAEIIAVGTELLLGDILNTNAQYLSQRLSALGIDVFYQSVVGDNAKRLKAILTLAKQRCDVIITTGGLGPTQDDLTKQTVAQIFEDELYENKEQLAKIESFFTASGRTMPLNNKSQAKCPVRGKIIENFNGTAPGAIFENNNKYAVLLPGPPFEMQPMFEAAVEPWLMQLSESAMHSVVLRTVGVGESHLEEMLLKYLILQNPSCALYAKQSEVIIRVTAKAQTIASAKMLANEQAKEIEDLLQTIVYAKGEVSLEETVVNLLKQRRLTLSTAESCTGGLLSAKITNVSGASEVFGFGLCTYANTAKMQLLNVEEKTLNEFGAVSSQTATQMARGIASLAKADIGVSITGIAGPTGGTKDKPVGLVYIGVNYENKVYIQKMLYENRSRDTVRQGAVQRALNLVRLLILKAPLPKDVKEV